MGIDEKMILIESMAKASLPVVGFTNFMIEKGSSVDVDVIGRRYLEIIKKYKCFGEGNRPHYLNVEMPGGSDGIVYRRFFDGLSGAQFYANRLYGVLALDFGAYDEQIDERALESVKEYLMFNKDNIRFILRMFHIKAQQGYYGGVNSLFFHRVLKNLVLVIFWNRSIVSKEMKKKRIKSRLLSVS